EPASQSDTQGVRVRRRHRRRDGAGDPRAQVARALTSTRGLARKRRGDTRRPRASRGGERANASQRPGKDHASRGTLKLIRTLKIRRQQGNLRYTGSVPEVRLALDRFSV